MLALVAVTNLQVFLLSFVISKGSLKGCPKDNMVAHYLPVLPLATE